MIIDQLSRLAFYESCHPDIRRVRDWLAKNDLNSITEGKHELGGGLYYAVGDYLTSPLEACKTECHRAHIDLQIMIRGHERIGYAPLELCTPITEYNAEKDVMFLKGDIELLTLRPDNFMLLFPNDVHTPGSHPIGGKSQVCKVVFKLPVK